MPSRLMKFVGAEGRWSTNAYSCPALPSTETAAFVARFACLFCDIFDLSTWHGAGTVGPVQENKKRPLTLSPNFWLFCYVCSHGSKSKILFLFYCRYFAMATIICFSLKFRTFWPLLVQWYCYYVRVARPLVFLGLS